MDEEEKDLSTAFLEYVEKIGTYLEKSVIKTNIKVSIQKEESTIEIPDIGRNFGTIYENGNLIIAKWINNLSKNERRYLIDYFLLREAIRLYFDEVNPEHPYERLTEIILYIIGILWLCEENKYNLIDRAVYVVRYRAVGYEDKDILKSQYWTWFLENSFKYNITAKQLFQIFVQRIKDVTEEKKPINDLAWDFVYWLRTFMPEEVAYALPTKIKKKRLYELIKVLDTTPFKKSSALAISEKIDRSHRVISRDFKQLLDDYNINWFVDFNILKIRLYPYFFRINLKKKEYKDQLVKKITSIRYIKFLKEGESIDSNFLIGWLESPQIIYRELSEYFKKLKKKDLIDDYFIAQIRHKKITWSITTKELKPAEKTYQTLLENPEKYNSYTIEALEKTYDITKYEEAKAEYYHEDVLLFLSSVILHRLGRAYYICRPVELKFKLCEKKEIDTTNTSEVMDFINQMDIRLRRLGLVDYFLYFKEFVHIKKALYFELHENPEDIYQIVKQLEVFGDKMTITFLDRVVIYFPEVKYDSVFREFVEKFLQENNITYKVYQFNHHRGLNVDKINYLEAYDFDSKQWKID